MVIHTIYHKRTLIIFLHFQRTQRVPLMRHILPGRHARHFPECHIERAFRTEPAAHGNFLHGATPAAEQFLGVFHPVTVQQLLQVAAEVAVHRIAQVSLVRLEHRAQRLQRKRGIEEYLAHLQQV